MHKKARASALAFVSLCKKVKFFSTKVKKACYKEGVKTKGVDIMTYLINGVEFTEGCFVAYVIGGIGANED